MDIRHTFWCALYDMMRKTEEGLYMKKLRILMDCDTGTDDAIALVCAANTPNVELRAVTTVAGNADLCFTAPNTLNLMRYIGCPVKVSKGAETPIKRVLSEIREKVDEEAGQIDTHGDNGLGGIVLPEAKDGFYPLDAVDTIYEEAKACGGELVIIATGPLTNIANAITKHPELKDGLIKKIVFMGGAAKGGNTTAVAEFNWLCDPEAAHIVLMSGIPCVMVGLDVTEKAEISDEFCDRVRTLRSNGAKVCSEILEFMRARRDTHGGESTLMHDGLALAAAVIPDVVSCRHLFVDAECDGKYTFGHSFVAFDNRLGDFTPNCDVALEVNVKMLEEYMWDCLIRSEEKR